MPEISAVFVRLGKFFVVISLVAMLGAHWTLLQTVAWTTMFADNLRTHSLSESVTRTFDGQYPCPICRAIAAAKKSEQKSEFILQLQKQEFPPPRGKPRLVRAVGLPAFAEAGRFPFRISPAKTADAAATRTLRLIQSQLVARVVLARA